MMHIVVPFGFYGCGNIGDEATLSGFARLLPHSGLVTCVSVGSRDPVHTARVEPAFRYFSVSRADPRRWWAKLGASAHAVVGGTPIMDVEGDWPLCEVAPLVCSSERWKVPFAFIGVGIETLRLEKSRGIVATEIVPRVRHWSVRSERDRQRLIDYGASRDAITVAADMAWLIDPATDEFGRDRLRQWGLDPGRPLIGVNLVNENSVLDVQPQMVDALAEAIGDLASELDAQVVFLANEVRDEPTFDRAAATRVIGRMTCQDCAVLAPSDYLSPRQMMSIISCCDLTISMRYHFCLFSALQGVPFVAIERSDKIADFCWDLDWPARVAPPAFEAADVIAHGTLLKRTASAARQQLKRNVQKMKVRALKNLAALDALSETVSHGR